MKVFFAMALLLCMSATAHALSDKDYEQYMKSSPAFSQSEERMNIAWKRLKAVLTKEQYTALLVEQRSWLKERDMLAEKRRQKNGGILVDAYTAENHKRAEELEARIPSPLGNGTSILQTAVPAPSAPVPRAPSSSAVPAGPVSPASPIVSSTPQATVVPSPAAPKADAAPQAHDKPKPPVVTTPATPAPAQPVAPQAVNPNSPVSPGAPVPLSPLVPPSSTASRNNAVPVHTVIGTYRNEFGTVMITNTATGYTFTLNTASPDGNWVCSSAGQGRLEGDIFTFALPDGTEPQMLKVKFSGKTLSISRELNAGLNLTYFCGNGGTLEGQYTKR